MQNKEFNLKFEIFLMISNLILFVFPDLLLLMEYRFSIYFKLFQINFYLFVLKEVILTEESVIASFKKEK